MTLGPWNLASSHSNVPGLVMEPNSATRPDYKQAAAATQSVIKAEDDYEDDDVYRSRPQLQQPAVLMRSLTELMSK